MNDIDNLLGKYFNGASSAGEEKRLKNYFKGTGVLPEHEVYRPLFAVFNAEKQIKAPVITLPEKKTKMHPFSRRLIIWGAGSAAVALLAVTLSILRSSPTQHPEYVVIINGKTVVNRHKARKYAENMFGETEKIIESSYQPFREAANIKEGLNAGKILRETEQQIEQIKTNYKE
ncbi:MAG: hypothetical protein LBB62_06475 [Proteiniphilum sp.]|jgi:hypothetical protein|nr:hypothetical protein [Proteiniphilum sp.]